MVHTEFLPRLQGSVDPKSDIDNAYAKTFGFVVSDNNGYPRYTVLKLIIFFYIPF